MTTAEKFAVGRGTDYYIDRPWIVYWLWILEGKGLKRPGVLL